MSAKDDRIKQLEYELARRDATIAMLKSSIDKLNQQIENLTEAIMLMRRERYAPSSEQTPKSKPDGENEQMSIFNEAEVSADARITEPIKKDKKGLSPRKDRISRKLKLEDLDIDELEYHASAESLFCKRCGTKLKIIGKEVVREELQYIPAQLKIIRHIRIAYECPKCKHSDRPYIVKTKVPQSLMNHSLASASSVAYAMYQKYVNAVPLYRQEKDWERMGLALSRATLANWIIRCSEGYFAPIIEHMHNELIKRDVIHADETPIQILKEKDRSPQSKSYMWVYRTGNDGKASVIIFDYKPSRNGDNAVRYLKDFKGYVQCDGYSGYNKLTDVVRCGCWAHLRRKFVEAIPNGKATESGDSNAEIGRNYCDKLFNIEDGLKDLDPEERYAKRLELERPVLDAFWSWLEKVNYLKGSKLFGAVTYAMNQKPYMEKYLLDGRCSISNNLAENAIRPFATGRKNWLFADTPKGADASARVYSIVETAKANGLDVLKYLEELLLAMPMWDHTDGYLESMMPWSDHMQKHCRA